MAADEPTTIRVLRWGLWLQVPAALMAAGYGVAEVGDSSGWWSVFLGAGVVLDVVGAATFAACAVALGGGARWVLRAMTAVAWLILIQGIVLMLNGHFFAAPSWVLATAQLRAARHGAEEWFDA
ncbi:hypothetical protein AB0K15_38535 [Amycolatopsis sp. NPDC049253]|uniref:hypothetical protein n=1 Tax=Amycolatopsis sp. NPDC049253 TaxID=3155274 RepID=UPI00341AE4E4